jgi:hypothetical protein
MGNDLFAERLRRFKEKENPEAVLLVAEDPEFTKIVVAWTSLDVRSVEKPSRPSGESDARYGTGCGQMPAIPSRTWPRGVA